ncbi:hypothetical protein QTO02_13015, partial [Vibrio fortis]
MRLVKQGRKMQLPASLTQHSQSALENLLEHQGEAISTWSPQYQEQLNYVLGLSSFVGDCLQRDSELAKVLPSM